MVDAQEYKGIQNDADEMFLKTDIFVTPDDKAQIEDADFVLGDYEHTVLGVLVHVNIDRCCAQELSMLPRQTCPEHMHPLVGSDPGKEETFRCGGGKVYHYVPESLQPDRIPRRLLAAVTRYTVFNEVALNPGDQYTIGPTPYTGSSQAMKARWPHHFISLMNCGVLIWKM